MAKTADAAVYHWVFDAYPQNGSARTIGYAATAQEAMSILGEEPRKYPFDRAELIDAEIWFWNNMDRAGNRYTPSDEELEEIRNKMARKLGIPRDQFRIVDIQPDRLDGRKTLQAKIWIGCFPR